MPQQSMCAIDEQRRATRFEKDPDSEFAAVWLSPHDEILAEVHDESLGGLGLLVDDASKMRPGVAAHVVYLGRLYHCMIRHVERQASGLWIVGMSCDATCQRADDEAK